MSAQDSVSTVYKCMLRGAADFLVKPVRKNELKVYIWMRNMNVNDASGGFTTLPGVSLHTPNFKNFKKNFLHFPVISDPQIPILRLFSQLPVKLDGFLALSSAIVAFATCGVSRLGSKGDSGPSISRVLHDRRLERPISRDLDIEQGSHLQSALHNHLKTHGRRMSTPARKRLMRDFKRLQQDPPVGIIGAPVDNNIMLWNAVIFGYFS
ncbi:hypothetical protein LXL04_020484 [Taraxacum kok-saghyz]